MDGNKDWAFPTTRVGDAIKFRPAALQILYRLGCDPWAEGSRTLQEIGERHGRKAGDLVQELLDLPVPDADSPWEELPAYHLIDYLTVEHRELIHSDLPGLRSILEMPFGEVSGSGFFRILLQSFHGFTRTLRAHVQEEESRIFPGILENEHALRNGNAGDRFFPIAGRVLASAALLHGEDGLDEALEQWSRDLASEAGGLREGSGTAAMAAQAMGNLERKLRLHGRLERDVLFHIAARIEDELAATAAR